MVIWFVYGVILGKLRGDSGKAAVARRGRKDSGDTSSYRAEAAAALERRRVRRAVRVGSEASRFFVVLKRGQARTCRGFGTARVSPYGGIPICIAFVFFPFFAFLMW